MRLAGVLASFVLGAWLALAPSAVSSSPQAAGPFEDWAAVVVAGDWHAHSGGPTEAFDNARRDVGHALVGMGFAPENIREFSARPQRYHDPNLARSEYDAIHDALTELSARTSSGCLVYFSSHGSPAGVVVADRLWAPTALATLLDETCGERPTIVVISACFSGVFVPTLARPNRMVLTAARPDRSSFGCGEADRYPFFDECFLRSVGPSHDFPQLGHAVQACVAARELKEHMKPPSEPQLWVGPAIGPVLPLYAFPGRRVGTD